MTTGAKAPVPIAVPSFGAAEQEAALAPLRSGWVAQGPRVASFEAGLTQRTGASFSLSCTSGTAALHLALAALGVGPGDEVVVPAFTWIATANVVELLGARAVLCDVDPHTFCSHAEHFASVISPRTRALMPVHLFGHVAPMEPIMDLARLHGLAVVEDAACALGSLYEGKHAGTFGDAGAFSFHPRKIITAGEGGAVVTSQEALAQQLASLRNHGAGGGLLLPDAHKNDFIRQGEQAWRDQHPGAAAYAMPDFIQPGFNYRMNDIQGAILDVQLQRLDEFVTRRQWLARRYDAALALHQLPLAPPPRPQGMVHSFQSYVVRVLPEAPLGRDALADALARDQIQTRQGTHAVHLLAAYRDRYQPEDLPGALASHQHSLALPLFPALAQEDQDRVIQALVKALT